MWHLRLLVCPHQPTHLNLVGHYSIISGTESAEDTTAADNVKLEPSPQLSAGEALLCNAIHAGDYKSNIPHNVQLAAETMLAGANHAAMQIHSHLQNVFLETQLIF